MLIEKEKEIEREKKKEKEAKEWEILIQEDQKKEAKVITFFNKKFFIIIDLIIDNFYSNLMRYPDVLNDAAIPEYEPAKASSEKKKNKKGAAPSK